MGEQTKVRYEVDDGLALITLNRPDRLNAMDAEVFSLLYEHGRRASQDPSVRAILVAGEGRSFSSGLDVSIFAAGAGETDSPRVDISRLQRAFTVYEASPKPTVAALQGHVLGGGLQLAIACDLRLAASGTTLAAAELRWGIIPDLGGTTRLPRLIGLARAKEMVMTGRGVDAEEAAAWGLVNRVIDPASLLKEATELARSLASGPPLAIAAAKRLATGAFDRSTEAGLEREAEVQRVLLASEDVREAVAATFEKRPPRFKAR